MIGCTGNYENQDADPATTPQDVYVHGYVSGRVFRLAGNSPGEEGEEGVPVSVCAT